MTVSTRLSGIYFPRRRLASRSSGGRPEVRRWCCSSYVPASPAVTIVAMATSPFGDVSGEGTSVTAFLSGAVEGDDYAGVAADWSSKATAGSALRKLTKLHRHRARLLH
jgi:hypothetical protein